MNPIFFELKYDDKKATVGFNPIDSEEVLIIKQWEHSTLYLKIYRFESGVLDQIDHCKTADQTADDDFHESLAEHYTCLGFAPDGYLTDLRMLAEIDKD